jgi:hypothetical protein
LEKIGGEKGVDPKAWFADEGGIGEKNKITPPLPFQMPRLPPNRVALGSPGPRAPCRRAFYRQAGVPRSCPFVKDAVAVMLIVPRAFMLKRVKAEIIGTK